MPGRTGVGPGLVHPVSFPGGATRQEGENAQMVEPIVLRLAQHDSFHTREARLGMNPDAPCQNQTGREPDQPFAFTNSFMKSLTCSQASSGHEL